MLSADTRGHIEQARAAIDAQGAEYDQPNVLADLPLHAREVGMQSLARSLVEEAVALARRLRLPWPLTRALVVLSAVDEDADGDQALTEALELTAANGYTQLWRTRESAIAAPALARALRGRPHPPPPADGRRD